MVGVKEWLLERAQPEQGAAVGRGRGGVSASEATEVAGMEEPLSEGARAERGAVVPAQRVRGVAGEVARWTQRALGSS
ncbi:hypothetical protein ACP70R_003720 [Stipagrostis hirtigluma subsp. patula]